MGRCAHGSLSLPLARETAHIAFAFNSLAAGDTAAARARLVPLLATHTGERPLSVYRPFHSDHLLIQIVRVGGVEKAVRWARAQPDPLARAAALMSVSDALMFWLNASELNWASYPYDMCRDEF